MALYAGSSPKITPVPTANPTDIRTVLVVIAAATEVWTALMIVTTAKLKSSHMIPQIPVRRMDSVRTCSRISPLSAPMDLLIPISLVLSETVTSMMFMTPIPQTRREMAAIAPKNNFSVPMTLVMVARVSAEFWIWKFASFGSEMANFL